MNKIEYNQVGIHHLDHYSNLVFNDYSQDILNDVSQNRTFRIGIYPIIEAGTNVAFHTMVDHHTIKVMYPTSASNLA